MTTRAIRNTGIGLFIVGMMLASYGQFFYDPTIAPMDDIPSYDADAVAQSGTLAERASAVNEIASRYQRTLDGERIVDQGRVEQRQGFRYFGLFIAFAGAMVTYIGVQRRRAGVELERGE